MNRPAVVFMVYRYMDDRGPCQGQSATLGHRWANPLTRGIIWFHTADMDFEALVWQAIRRCEGQAGLARTLGYNKNSVRQWLLGLSLPDVGVEARLAQLAGVTPDILRQAIRDEMTRRWDQARNRPTTRRSRLGRPPQLADPTPLPVVGQRSESHKNASDKKRRRGQTVIALLTSLGLGLATLGQAADAAPVTRDSVALRRRRAA